jgi:hypothetical protein
MQRSYVTKVTYYRTFKILFFLNKRTYYCIHENTKYPKNLVRRE